MHNAIDVLQKDKNTRTRLKIPHKRLKIPHEDKIPRTTLLVRDTLHRYTQLITQY